MADGRHIGNRFFGYISAPYWPINANFGMEMKNHMQMSVADQNGNFRKPNMADHAILKITLSPYLSRELSDFDQIWYADANFYTEDGYLTKIEIFQIQDGGLTPY